jgi:hypothetical protein
MDWNMIGNLAQAVSTIAVVISLLYLARQMRQGTATARAAAYQSFVEQQAAVSIACLADPRIASVFHRVVVKRESITTFDDLDKTAALIMCAMQARIYETMYRQVKDGILNPADLNLVANITYLTSPGWREAWPRVSQALSPDFVAYFNERHGAATTELFNAENKPSSEASNQTLQPTAGRSDV